MPSSVSPGLLDDGDQGPPPPLAPPDPSPDPLVPQQGDTALLHDLRRRLAVDVLAGAQRGDMTVALDTLREIAVKGDSDKVRAKAAADLARVMVTVAQAKPAHVNVGTVNVVSAADLVSGVDPVALRAAMDALGAARRARVLEVAGGAEFHTPGAPPGSDRPATGGAEGTPFSTLTGFPGNAEAVSPGPTGPPVPTVAQPPPAPPPVPPTLTRQPAAEECPW